MPAMHEFPPLTLCIACQRLFNPPPRGKSYLQTSGGRRLRIFGESSEDEADHAVFGSDAFHFQKKRRDVEEGCRGDCEICQWILLNDKSCDRSDEEEALDFTEEDFKSGRRPPWWPPEDQELDFRFEYDEEDGKLRLCPSPEEQWDREKGDWYVWVAREDPAAKLPIPRVSLADVGSLERLADVRPWLSECVAEHGRCPDNESAELPTRLVEVSPPGAPVSARLRTTGGGRGCYATLSYCWGGLQPFQTMTDSLAAHMSGLPLPDLPRTILDALEVTRRLGLRYIWIDSLCIIQDDLEDKNRELPRMLRIYENSFITVSAASARSCHEGFLDPRLTSRSPRHLRVRVDDRQTGTILVGKQAETLEFGDHISQPINNRAWTLQESWVAPRLLVFGGLAVVWRCACTTWQGGLPRRPRRTDVDTDSDSDSSSSAPVISDNEMYWNDFSGYVIKSDLASPAGNHQAWHDLVENYTRRALTVQGDKLPAISAVAEKLAPSLGGGRDYLAGLWRRHLVSDLLWHASLTGAEEALSEPRAPSWSWASHPGRVKFAQRPVFRSDVLPLCSIVGCSVVLAAEGVTYGAVVRGELVVEGDVADVGGRLEQLAAVYWDDPEGRAVDTALPCWALTIASHDQWGYPQVLGLLLMESRLEDGSFRRVGYFELGLPAPSEYLQAQERRVVRIV